MHNTPQFYSKIEKQYRGVKKTTATPQPFMRPLYPRSFQSSRILDLTDDLMNMNTPWHFDRYLHIHSVIKVEVCSRGGSGIPSPSNYGVVRSPAGSGAEPGRKSLVHFICHRTHPVKEKFNLFIDILTQINLQL